MSDAPETVVRNAYLANRDAVVDITIDDGLITAVQPAIADNGETELDAEGDLVSPGLIDAHVHLDMALSATGDRLPRNNEGWAGRIDAIEKTATYFAEIEADAIVANVYEVAEWAIGNGVLHLRTHAYVDNTVGPDVVEAVATARDALDDRLDIEIVAFPQQGIRRDEGSEAAL
jgi:cytosine/adenosine deaminase-related metal-dependent hydrolase